MVRMSNLQCSGQTDGHGHDMDYPGPVEVGDFESGVTRQKNTSPFRRLQDLQGGDSCKQRQRVMIWDVQ